METVFPYCVSILTLKYGNVGYAEFKIFCKLDGILGQGQLSSRLMSPYPTFVCWQTYPQHTFQSQGLKLGKFIWFPYLRNYRVHWILMFIKFIWFDIWENINVILKSHTLKIFKENTVLMVLTLKCCLRKSPSPLHQVFSTITVLTVLW